MVSVGGRRCHVHRLTRGLRRRGGERERERSRAPNGRSAPAGGERHVVFGATWPARLLMTLSERDTTRALPDRKMQHERYRARHHVLSNRGGWPALNPSPLSTHRTGQTRTHTVKTHRTHTDATPHAPHATHPRSPATQLPHPHAAHPAPPGASSGREGGAAAQPVAPLVELVPVEVLQPQPIHVVPTHPSPRITPRPHHPKRLPRQPHIV